MPNPKITWRLNAEAPPIYEAVIDGVMVGWIVHRPHYCDRGHWQAQVELTGIDYADGFPRYFMRLSAAVEEMERFLLWRLFCLPSPDPLTPEQFMRNRGTPLLVPDGMDD